MEGISLRPFFDQTETQPRTLYWEHMRNCGIRDGKWKLVTAKGGGWELYDMEVDPTELDNLIDAKPEMAEAMLAKWAAWARRVGVRNVDALARLKK